MLPCAYRRFIGVAPLSCGRVDGTDGGFHLKSIRVYRPRTSLSAEFSIDEAPAAPEPCGALLEPRRRDDLVGVLDKPESRFPIFI